MKLVLIRHGESEWNKKNLFTGWIDVELSEKGVTEAKNAGTLLQLNNYDFDIVYTSYLKRAIHTAYYVLDEMNRVWLPMVKAWELNERHYGALQGLNKKETTDKYGEEQVKIWRRSFDVLPPSLEASDPTSPFNDVMYRNVDKNKLPLAESLELTIARTVPYFENVIKKEMISGKNVLIVAHGNSIRALVKHFEKLNNKEIIDVNIPNGTPLVYEFDDAFNVINHFYLGNQEEIDNKMNTIKNPIH